MPIPCWRISIVVILSVALVFALSQGHPWDAAIIALLLIPGVALLVLALYLRRKPAGLPGEHD